MENEQYQDGYDALRRMLDGHRSNAVAMALMEYELWPSMPAGSAAARVRANLNPESDQFFKFSEIVFLMWWTGRIDPVLYACEALGYERPKKKRALRDLEKARRELADVERRADRLRRDIQVKLGREGDPLPAPMRFLREED